MFKTIKIYRKMIETILKLNKNCLTKIDICQKNFNTK